MTYDKLVGDILLALAPIALAAATAGLHRLVRFLESKVQEIHDRRLREDLNTALAQAERLAGEVATAVEQTFVQALKQSGKWDGAAAAQAKALALEQLRKLVGPSEALLRQAIGDVETYLSNLIESRVFALKTWK